MTEPLRIVIPGEMRGKGRPRFSTRGGFARAFTDSKTVNAEAWVKACAVEAGAFPAGYPLRLRMEMVAAVPKSWSKRNRETALAGGLMPTGKPDIDNCLKLVCDALNGIAWQDDKQIVWVEARKRYGETAETVLEVWPA